MIFVSVGAQMPFDRLVRTVDAWAADHPDAEVFAQIGPTDWRPAHIAWTRFLEPAAFRAKAGAADALVAHAGMGSILTALELGKPILVLPRQAALHETRNDHQVATARRFDAMGRVAVAYDEDELPAKLDALLGSEATERISGEASPELIAALRSFIHEPVRRTLPQPLPDREGSARGELKG